MKIFIQKSSLTLVLTGLNLLANTALAMEPCKEVIKAGQFPAIGTSCVTKKQVVFQRVQDLTAPDGSGETGWQDTKTGLILFDHLETALSPRVRGRERGHSSGSTRRYSFTTFRNLR